MRAVRFHTLVETDLDEAVAWYDAQQMGLGDRFLGEFRDAVGTIARIGHVFRRPDGVYRHIKLERFPYLVFFREDEESFLVILVINAARDPAFISGLLHDRR